MPDGDLAQRLSAVTRLAPSLAEQFPGLTLGIAEEPEALRTASEIEGFRESVFRARQMTQLSVSHQYSLWEGLDAATQERMNAVGYMLPHQEDPGWFEEHIGRPIGYVVGGTVGNLVEGANKLASGAAGNLQHFYRTLKYLDVEDAVREGRTTTTLGFSRYFGENFGRAWRTTANGDDLIAFPTESLAAEGIRLPSDVLQVAMDAARGFTPEQLSTVYGSLATTALENPDYAKAVQVLDGSRLSFGRGLATGIGLEPGSAAFKAVSGSADGVTVFAADPFNFVPVGQIRKTRDLRRLVQVGDDVRRIYETVPANARAINRVVAILEGAPRNDGGKLLASSRLITEMPSVAPLVDDLIESGAQTTDEVLDFFAGKVALREALSGEAGVYERHLSMSRAQGLWAGARSGLAGFADGMEAIPGYERAAKSLRSFTTQVGKGRSFNPRGPEAVAEIRKRALTVLPASEVDTFTDAWSAANLGGKLNLYRGLMRSMASAMHADAIPEVAEHFDGIIGTLADLGHRYGADVAGNERGVLTIAGQERRFGVLASQIEEVRWQFPDFRELGRAMSATSRLRQTRFFGWLPKGYVESFTDKVWKPGKVLTPIQGLRQGLEEVLGYVAERNVIPAVRARLGLSAAKATELQTMPHGRGKYLRWVVDEARRRLGPVEGIAGGDRMVDAANDLLELYGPRALHQLADPHNKKILDTGPGVLETFLDSNGKAVNYELKPGGLYTNYTHADELQPVAWHGRLNDLLGQKQTTVVLDAFERGEDAGEALRRWYASNDPKAARLLESSGYVDELLSQGVTREEAIRRFAVEGAEAIRGITHAPSGEVIPEVVAGLRKGDLPSAAVLDKLRSAGRAPMVMSGRQYEVLPTGRSLAQHVVEWGFEQVDRQMAFVSRQPIMVAEYARFRRALEPSLEALKRSGLAEEAASGIVKRNAAELAARSLYRHIDDPAVRSMFAWRHGALFPFWYAQDQFIRRWGKRILRDPGSARRAQLAVMGLEHSGFVEEQDGQSVFHYPSAAWAQGVLFKTLGVLTGNKTLGSVNVKFTGNLKYVLPIGFDPANPAAGDGVRPGVGPLVSVPLRLLHNLFPELAEKVQDPVEGEFANQPVWNQLVPSVGLRVLRAFDEDQRASLVMGAMQSLEAAGRGLPDDATAEEIEVYKDALRGAMTIAGVVRGVLGSSVPGGAKMEFANDLSGEFIGLVNALGIEQGTVDFLRRHPGADAYTVFKSESVAGTRKPLQATVAAGQFFKQHRSLFEKYGAAATWLLPQGPGEFDPVVWREQLALGLRREKAPLEFYMDLKAQAAAQVYYSTRDQYDVQIAQAFGAAADTLEEAKSAWSQEFLAAHPALQQQIGLGFARSGERTAILERIGAMLVDPKVPAVPEVGAMSAVIDAYRTYLVTIDTYRGQSSAFATMQRKMATTAMLDFGRSQTNVTARMLFEAYVMPDLETEE